jgi:hypothetical protein
MTKEKFLEICYCPYVIAFTISSCFLVKFMISEPSNGSSVSNAFCVTWMIWSITLTLVIEQIAFHYDRKN